MSLLEKAFAKLKGGYDKIEGGVPSSALHALTGSATEQIEHTEIEHPDDLWRLLEAASTDGDVVVAATSDDVSPLAGFAVLCAPFQRCCDPISVFTSAVAPRCCRRSIGLSCRRSCWGCFACFSLLWTGTRAFCGALLTVLTSPFMLCGVCKALAPYASKGIVPGHSYSMLSVYDVKCCLCCVKRLVKLRNPWGQGEWVGPWSNRSCLWCCVGTKDKDRIGHMRGDDGVFFMAVNDYTAHFQSTSICRLRQGWTNMTVPTIIRGPCAYWTITVETAAAGGFVAQAVAKIEEGGLSTANPLIKDSTAVGDSAPSANVFSNGEPSNTAAVAGDNSGSNEDATTATAAAFAVTDDAASTATTAGNPFKAAPGPSSSPIASSAVVSANPMNLTSASASGAAKDDTIVVVNPINSNGSGVGAGGGFRGVRCFASILHSDGTTPQGALEGNQACRLSIFADDTRKPIGSSRAPSAMSSYSPSATCSTGMMFLEAGRTYTVFAQWKSTDAVMRSVNGRPVTLLLTVSDGSSIQVTVPAAGPVPRLPWAPASSLFGNCAKCRMPLPPEFDFNDGRRYHPECTPVAK